MGNEFIQNNNGANSQGQQVGENHGTMSQEQSGKPELTVVQTFESISDKLAENEVSWDDVSMNIEPGDSVAVDQMQAEFETPADFVNATSMAVQDYQSSPQAEGDAASEDFIAEEKSWSDRWKALAPTLAKGGVVIAKAALTAAVPGAGPVISGVLAGLQFADGLLE